jgi:predicted esterase
VITEHHLVVRKTARYCVLGDLDETTSDLWIACHGFGHLARDFIQSFEPVARRGRAVVAPEALSRFYRSQGTVHTPETPVGATWMTSEDREAEIADYVVYLDTLLQTIRAEIDPEARVTALGFSQGAATISRWVAAASPKIDRLILWGGLLPPEFNNESSLGGLLSQPMSFVVGNSDRYFDAQRVESELNRLKGLKIPLSFTRFEGGHSIEPQTLKALAA